MHRGRIQTVLEREDATEERVVGAALGLDPVVRLKPDTTADDDSVPDGAAG
jgi:hypothetical protein